MDGWVVIGRVIVIGRVRMLRAAFPPVDDPVDDFVVEIAVEGFAFSSLPKDQ